MKRWTLNQAKPSQAKPSKYYYSSQDNKGQKAPFGKEEGLAICVKGNGKTGTHGAIYTAFNQMEYSLGGQGSQKWTTTLGKLEDAAAKSISLATGCNEADLKGQLRRYHASEGFDESNRLRADSLGKNTAKEDPVWTMRRGGEVF